MPAARRNRTYAVVAASLGIHAILVAVVAVQAPRLRVPPPASGPPEPVIPILIMPRAPPPAASPDARPTPIRLHRRPQRFAPTESEVAPLIAPTAEETRRTATTPGPRNLAEPNEDERLAARARGALRGTLDCDNPRLTRAEREGCQERFARGGRDAPFLGLGVDRDKAAELQAAGARRQQDFNYKRGIRPPAPPTEGAGWDQYRGPPGQAEAMGAALGNDRPAARVPF